MEFLYKCVYGILLCQIYISCVTSYNPYQCVKCMGGHKCNPPDCFCCRDTMPVQVKQVPQMVFFTFDDAITPPVANFYRKLFDSKRKNPNGCPVKMTLFISHANTVYRLVREFYTKGMEIGSHSVSHRNMNSRTFKREAKKQKENLARKAGIPMSKIKGWRSPFLKPIGDVQPDTLKDLGYDYDATLTIGKTGLRSKAPIPFTLDYGWPYRCKIKPCPKTTHKGFWEVPVVTLMDYKEDYECVYVDGCTFPPPNEDAAFKFLWKNFESYYNNNRAPFGINMHASWFYYPDRFKAMDRFIKELGKLNDVYIVSVSQVLSWLRQPTTLSNIKSFEPWGCGLTPRKQQNNTSVSLESVINNNLQLRQGNINKKQTDKLRQLQQWRRLVPKMSLNNQRQQSQTKSQVFSTAVSKTLQRVAPTVQTYRQKFIQKTNIQNSPLIQQSKSKSVTPTKQMLIPKRIVHSSIKSVPFSHKQTKDNQRKKQVFQKNALSWVELLRQQSRRLQLLARQNLQSRNSKSRVGGQQKSFVTQTPSISKARLHRLQNYHQQQLLWQKQIKEQKRIAENNRIALQKVAEQERIQKQKLKAEKESLAEQKRLADLKLLQEKKRIEEQNKLAELKRIEEKNRADKAKLIAEQKRIEEEKRLAELKRIEEQKLIEKQKKIAELQRIAEAKRIAEQKRIEVEKRLKKLKLVEEQKRFEEQKRIKELKRIAEEKKIAEQKRIKEEKRLAELKAIQKQKRIAEQKRVAEMKLIEEQTRAAEAKRIAEEKRIKEEKQLAELKRKQEEQIIQEAKRLAELKRIEEQQQIEEQKRAVELKRLAVAKKLAEQNRVEKEKRLAELKQIQEQKRLEEEKRQEELKLIEEQKLITEKLRLEKEKRLAELKRINELKLIAEQTRLKAEKRLSQLKRINDQKRIAEQKRLNEEKYLAGLKQIDEVKRNTVQKLTEQRVAESMLQESIIAEEEVQNSTKVQIPIMTVNYIQAQNTDNIQARENPIKTDLLNFSKKQSNKIVINDQFISGLKGKLTQNNGNGIIPTNNPEDIVQTTLGELKSPILHIKSSNNIKHSTIVSNPTSTSYTPSTTPQQMVNTKIKNRHQLKRISEKAHRVILQEPWRSWFLKPQALKTQTSKRQQMKTTKISAVEIPNTTRKIEKTSTSTLATTTTVKPAPTAEPQYHNIPSLKTSNIKNVATKISAVEIPNTKRKIEKISTTTLATTTTVEPAPKAKPQYHDIPSPKTSNIKNVVTPPKLVQTSSNIVSSVEKQVVLPTEGIVIEGSESPTAAMSYVSSKETQPSTSTSSNSTPNSMQITTEGTPVCKQEINCFAPKCKCKSETVPGGLDPITIPQIVYITVDGDMNFLTYSRLRSLFTRYRRNPNGCPIRGTFFTSDKGYSFGLSHLVNNGNLEIALNGLRSTGYKNANTLAHDISEQTEQLVKRLHIQNKSSIKGWRSPGLRNLGDKQFDVLKNMSLYDSSLVSDRRDKDVNKLWPFTLDYGWNEPCKTSNCPENVHPGVWEVPIMPLSEKGTTRACIYADSCYNQPTTRSNTVKYLWDNFQSYYSTNKAPFGIHITQKWFQWYYTHNMSGLLQFLNRISKMKDVYVVSVSDVIEWVKHPTPLADIKHFVPWKC